MRNNIAKDAITVENGILYVDHSAVELFEGFDLDSCVSRSNIETVFKKLHLHEEYMDLASDGYIWVRSIGTGRIQITGIHCNEEFRRTHGDELTGKDGFKFLQDVLNRPSDYGVLLRDIIFENKKVDTPGQDWDSIVNANTAATNWLNTDNVQSRADVLEQHLDMLSGKYYMNSTELIGFPSGKTFEDDTLKEKFDESYEILESNEIPYDLFKRSSFRYFIDKERGITIIHRYTEVQVKVEEDEVMNSDLLCMSDDEGRKIIRCFKSINGDFIHIQLSDLGSSFFTIIGYDPESHLPIRKHFYVSPDMESSMNTCLLFVTFNTGKMVLLSAKNNTMSDDGNLRIQNSMLISAIPIKSITAYYEVTY